MTDLDMILGLFQNAEAASAVLKTLRRRRIHRSAAIYRGADGRTRVDDYDVSVLNGTILGCFTGLFLSMVANVFFLHHSALAWHVSPILITTIAMATGAAIGALLTRTFDFGVNDAVIAQYTRRLAPTETLVIVQAQSRNLDRILALLRSQDVSGCVNFVLLSPRFNDQAPTETLLRRSPLSNGSLGLEAGRLAAAIHPTTHKADRRLSLLHRLRDSEQMLRSSHADLGIAARVGQTLSISAEWFLDNSYVILGHIDDFRRNLPQRYYRELPIIAEGLHAGLPRVYGIAAELVADTDARLDQDTILNFLQSYQTVSPLTLGELWAVPLMLRLRLIECLKHLVVHVVRRQRESVLADLWANRLLTVVRRDPDRLVSVIAEMTEEIAAPSAHFADQLVAQLYDDEAVLSPVRGWLERKLGASLPDIVQQEHRDQAINQAPLSNAITSLRHLAQLDWRRVVELVSRVDAILWTDPADIYSRQDFATRDICRHVVEEIARRSKATEIEVALEALRIADEANNKLERQVVYYLLDKGRPTLESRLGYKPKLGQRMRRLIMARPTLVYLGANLLATAAIETCLTTTIVHEATRLDIALFLAILALLPASELSIQIVNYLITRILPPRALPKLNFESGIPDDFRTMVVVPMMLLTPDSIRGEVERLEVRYLANPDPNLRYALLSDFCDAPAAELADDFEMLDVASRSIESLNEKYGAGRFFLFHRRRRWCESEGVWMGWERKRGKLEDLNRFLSGAASDEFDDFLRVGDAKDLCGVKFVITLDSDTQLPPNTAQRLVATLAHPLNRPQLSADGLKVERGYTILQPRVTTSLPSATATLFTRLFADTAGLDPYTRAISDVYQDLTGEGSYNGKGIYDVATFNHILAGLFPESRVLSHDLLEGAHVRVGLASDIELLDLFPRDYIAYSNRQHRWTRGDWQIANWLLSTVPAGNNKSGTNRITLLSRWKILDNLRRSLQPVSSVAFLVAAWLFSPAAAVASLFIAAVQFTPAIIQIVPRIWPNLVGGRAWRSEFATPLCRAAVLTALLPHHAGLALDAIWRSAWRQLVSHRHLLEWDTAQEVHRRAKNRRYQFMRRMAWIPCSAVALTVAAAFLNPGAAFAFGLFTALWVFSPAIVAFLSGTARDFSAQALSEEDRLMLRQTARLTWRYFDDFVCPQSNHLPPDNYQEFLRLEVAQRTSPTNIGLYLLSTLAAHDFGYATLDTVIDRVVATTRILDQLERYEGHLLNWYDIKTLKPLNPRYVSMVDSGNLLGALWTLCEGLNQLVDEPVLDLAALHGLMEPVKLVRKLLPDNLAHESPAVHILGKLDRLCSPEPNGLEDLIRRLRVAAEDAGLLVAEVEALGLREATILYWAQQIEQQTTAWLSMVDRYLPWVNILESPPEEGLLSLGSDAHEWRRQALAAAPSLRAIALGDVPGIRLPITMMGTAVSSHVSDSVHDWLEKLAEAASRAQWFAGEEMALAEEAIHRTTTLAEGMNMRFLYDTERRLFHIGFNVNDMRVDNAYYDLFASESRLGSFCAVARGEVPLEHWSALGRPFGMCHGERALLSWSGTMFEYLMPILLTRRFDNSLLDQACRSAVSCQMAYGRRRGIPWGISEAAYSALDARQIYQYRAFGVPGLGLKRGLDEDLVVAPYATALALAVAPLAAVKNLKRLGRLERIGDRGGYGYYESIDYTRQSGPEGERGVTVYAYMAHHQGMVLLSIDNVLHANVMQKRFHADPRVKAAESLFYERIPSSPPMTRKSVQEPSPPRVAPFTTGFLTGRINTPNTSIPRTQLLSNGNYTVMVTNAGGGYSQFRDFEITRWRADTARDACGSFCYIRDTDSGSVWSAAYHPTRVAASTYSVTFSVEKAEFRRRDNGIETSMEIVVSPEDDAEIRLITLVNRSLRRRQLEVTSYMELSMAPHGADRAHPAFNKLFIQTEALPAKNALLAWRRPRSASDAPIWTSHVVAMNRQFDEQPPEYETDRECFLGRNNTAENPAAMAGPLSGSAGAVLDPAFSLRRRIALDPGERIQISLITTAAESRDEVVAHVDKYSDIHASHRAIDLAWTHAQLELRHLRIQPDEALRYQQLASHLLYPSDQLRPSGDRLRLNTLNQSRLWTYGISGDLPILVVTIADSTDQDLVRQALMAHTFWRVHGLKADLLILNEESFSYEQPLHESLRRLVQAHAQYTGTEQPGGVFLRSTAQISEEDLTLILTVAQAVLVAARGSLSQQLASPVGPTIRPKELKANPQAHEDPSAPLPFMELPYYNGIGGFTTDGKEYAIYLGPNARTPAPWVNLMANPSFGAMATESGAGFCWYGNSQSNRLIPWSNDPVSDPVGDAIYIRDDDLGVYWSPTPLPIREMDAYRTRHGQGYTVYEHNSHAIEQELVVFVPQDDNGGAPVRIQRLRLTNRSTRRRRLTVTFYAEWVLGTTREETQMHVVSNWDMESQSLFARNAYHPDCSRRVAFATSNLTPTSYSADRILFLGRNGSPASPASMSYDGLVGRAEAGRDPCAAIQVSVKIDPGRREEIVFLLGQGADADNSRSIITRFRDTREVERALQTTIDWWDHYLGAVQVNTPSMSANLILNRWLLYQNLSCRLWARSAFHQSGGAFGFRDQLQDAMATVYSNSNLAREQILRAAARQFKEGDVQHWWHPQSGAGVRTRISDDLLWLPFVTSHYVKTTGDESILDEDVPFIEGQMLANGETEAFYIPTVATHKASLLEHCRMAIEKGSTCGPNGLPLIGGGDWNDGLNRVGVEGKGESVWLAWFLIEVMNDFAGLLRMRGDEKAAGEYKEKASNLAETVEKEAWDGEWYRRATFDDGTPLGSRKNEEARIDSLPQSWGVICGAARLDRSKQALRSVVKYLVDPDDKLVMLFTPPFDKSLVDPGYVKGYLPGVRENGGQYTHGSLWVPMAFARMGNGDMAVKLLQMMNPIEHALTLDDAKKYKVEPYVAAADVYALEGQRGRGGWTWYTGSAGWMYRVWLEEVLGFHLRGDTLRMEPVIPPAWDGFSLTYRHGSSEYEVVVENPNHVAHGVKTVFLDETEVPDQTILLRDEGGRHTVRIRLGRNR